MKKHFVKSLKIINFLLLLLIIPEGLIFAAKLSEIQEDELILGSLDAPITMIEYASMSCPHCAAFHTQTLPIIKEEYIDTGKVKLVFRDFPFNMPALQGSMITRCIDKEFYFKYLDALFALQRVWAMAADTKEALFKVMNNSGMTREEFDLCLNNKDLENKILSHQLEAQKEFRIKSTPSFIINGKLLEGNKSINTFRKTFDNILSN